MPRSRLKTYQRIRWPASATIVGVLPTNARPLKQYVGVLAAALLGDRVQVLACVGPHNCAAGTDRHARRLKLVVDDRYGRLGLAAHLDVHGAAHATPVPLAVVLDRARESERLRELLTVAEVPAVERRRASGAVHEVVEEGDVQHRAGFGLG